MKKRSFLKIIFTSTAGLVSLQVKPNAILKPEKNVNGGFTDDTMLPSESAVFSKENLKEYLEQLNAKKAKLNTEINELVFKPRNARDILVNGSIYTNSINTCASEYYNQKLFCRLIGSGRNEEKTKGGDIQKQIVYQFGSIQAFNDVLTNKALSCNDDFIWVSMQVGNPILEINSGSVSDNPLINHQRPEELLTVIALDMRSNVYRKDFSGKSDYVDSLMLNINWTVVNKRIKRFTSQG